jgi:hypothetical protein
MKYRRQTVAMTVELWRTPRGGHEKRLVTRRPNGQFVENISARQLRSAGLVIK